MSIAPIDRIEARLGRAEEQARYLRREVNTFTRSEFHLARPEKDATGRKHMWRAHLNPTPDVLRWSLILGEIIHNLRSTLNNLACEIVVAQDRSHDLSGIEFPVFKDREGRHGFGQGHRRKTRSMPSAVVAHIERLQPFTKRPNDPESHALWLLHALNVMDKHKLIIPTLMGIDTAKVAVPENCFYAFSASVEDGAVVFVIYSPEPVDEVPMKAQLAFAVAIQVGSRRYKLDNILRELIKESNGIVGELRQYL